VFAALADPTRRQLVDWLAVEDEGTATGFAARLPISRQAVTRHLGELERAGLVRSDRVGRETRYSLNPESLTEAADWLAARARKWDRALGRLQRHVESGEGSDQPRL
jgi:DNA-binding transcriptional ArsR family regulator